MYKEGRDHVKSILISQIHGERLRFIDSLNISQGMPEVVVKHTKSAVGMA